MAARGVTSTLVFFECILIVRTGAFIPRVPNSLQSLFSLSASKVGVQAAGAIFDSWARLFVIQWIAIA
jgi:hypothetical protein